MTDIVKIALIASTPPTLTAIALFIPLFRRIKKVADGVDGINTGLKLDAQRADSEKNEAQSKLSHAEGRREGIESTAPNVTSKDSVER